VFSPLDSRNRVDEGIRANADVDRSREAVNLLGEIFVSSWKVDNSQLPAAIESVSRHFSNRRASLPHRADGLCFLVVFGHTNLNNSFIFKEDVSIRDILTSCLEVEFLKVVFLFGCNTEKMIPKKQRYGFFIFSISGLASYCHLSIVPQYFFNAYRDLEITQPSLSWEDRVMEATRSLPTPEINKSKLKIFKPSHLL